ncbi:MAG: bifunctional diguanylate cyclase/phosphodiesterase [Treponemataceae bacterium]|nr:bifunctional diguanylate cyclase/phosphodiesterase [Treponemataceae bacterium]
MKHEIERTKLAEEETDTSMALLGKAVCHLDIEKKTFSIAKAFAVEKNIPQFYENAPESIIEFSKKFMSPENVERHKFFYEAILEGQPSGSSTFQIKTQNNEIVWNRFSFVTVFQDEKPARALITIEDVTIQRERSLIYERFKNEVLTLAPTKKHLYFSLDVTDNVVDSLPEYMSISTVNHKNMKIEELAELMQLQTYKNKDGVTAIERYTRNNLLVLFATQNYVSDEDWYIEHGGKTFWFNSNLQLVEDPFNRHILALFEVRNITEEKTKELKFWEQSRYDKLTGLYNFAAAEELIRNKLGKNVSAAILFVIEIDNFNNISSILEYDKINDFLKKFAELLRVTFEEPDIVASVSMSQFMIYTEKITSVPMFENALRDLQKKVSSSSISQEYENFKLSCSVGAALVTETAYDFSVLFNRVDLSLYHARSQGGNIYCLYSLSQLNNNSAAETRRNALMMLEKGGYRNLPVPENKLAVSFEEVFQWILQHHLMPISEVTMLDSPYDFLMLVNPGTHVIEYVEISRLCKDSSEFESLRGRKCYEPVLGKGRKYIDEHSFCEKCTKCQQQVSSVRKISLKLLNRDYIVYEKNIIYNGQPMHLQVFKYAADSSETATDLLKQNFSNQAFVISCMQTDSTADETSYIENILKKVCNFFGCESGFVCTFANSIGSVRYNIPQNQAVPTALDISQSLIDRWIENLNSSAIAFIFSTEAIKNENEVMYGYFKSRGITSVAITPIFCENVINGFLVLRNGSTNMIEMPFILNNISRTLGVYVSRIIREEESELQFFYDSLTGYLNFTGFQREIKRIFDKKTGDNFSLWYCDIKRFKFINDSFGFDVGNNFLRYFADIIASNLSENETFCRASSNNYCLLLRYQNINELVDRFNLMNRSLSEFFERFYENSYSAELAAGVYLFNVEDGNETLDEMLNRASMAQRNIKPLPGSNIGFYTEKMREQALKDIILETEMDAAIENEEFEIYLQPKVCINKDAEGSERFHAEALVRWVRDGEIFASPGDFIPLFEKSDKIIELDRYVFKKACKMVHRFRDAGLPVSIAVNISRVSLLHTNFVSTYADLIKQNGIKDGEIEIEFTEGVAVTELEPLIELMNELKKLGCICEMDDFGAGYSSLNVLQRLPLNGLKIDQKFFLEFDSVERQKVVVASILDMAQRLEMTTIAEGIETKDQVEMLKNLKCDYIQGFYFGKPMKEADYLKFISAYSSPKCSMPEKAPDLQPELF